MKTKQQKQTINKKMKSYIIIGIYYRFDKKGNKVFDIDSMNEEFQNKLKELKS